jgi:hypothetical protein
MWTLVAVGIRSSLLLMMPISHNLLLLLINTAILDTVTLFRVACRVRIRRHPAICCQMLHCQPDMTPWLAKLT